MFYTFSSIVPAAHEDVFSWHTRPGAFARLQPPWMPVDLESESTSLRDGQTVLKLPASLQWIASHDGAGFIDGSQFIDELTSNGLRSLPVSGLITWRHTHEFERIGDHKTLVRDRVETNLPAAAIKRMFAYRHEQLAADMTAQLQDNTGTTEQLTVAITGSSGLVGSALGAFLTTAGHRVVKLVRQPTQHPDERYWDPNDPDPQLLHGIDALVHLAGSPIAGRFTSAHKTKIWDSRIPATTKLAQLLARTEHGPKIFISASAIGYYGADHADEPLTENSPAGDDFLADLVSHWEAATQPAVEAGIRVVNIRTGLVQSTAGGMLAPLRWLYAAGLGGRIGNGQQWMSWIGLDDLVYVYHRALTDDRMSGPVNATAPQPVRNSEWSALLARILRRPNLLSVPRTGLRLLLGSQGADEFAAASQRVLPQVLTDFGHEFARSTLDDALRHELGHHRTMPNAISPNFTAGP